MNATVSQEFLLLLLDLGIGAGIGFLFDCYRAVRRLLRPGWLATQVGDLFFWICCALLAFQVFFMVTGGGPIVGAVGFYSLLIIPGGTLLYQQLISFRLQRPLLFFFRLLAWLFIIVRRAFWLLCLAVAMPFRGLWWLARACLVTVVVLLRLLWLPERLIILLLWRLLREGRRRLGTGWRPAPAQAGARMAPGCWVRDLLNRLLHKR